MSLLKYIDRLKRMDDLIRRKATGTPEEFSQKLNVSRSQLLQDLKELKELGAPVDFCRLTQSYYYTRECHVSLNFESSNIVGGWTHSPEWQNTPPFSFFISNNATGF
jgi:predicted DNA-binding transcriptional regulator YafY